MTTTPQGAIPKMKCSTIIVHAVIFAAILGAGIITLHLFGIAREQFIQSYNHEYTYSDDIVLAPAFEGDTPYNTVSEHGSVPCTPTTCGHPEDSTSRDSHPHP